MASGWFKTSTGNWQGSLSGQNWQDAASGGAQLTDATVPGELSTDIANFTYTGIPSLTNLYLNGNRTLQAMAFNATLTSGVTFLGGTSSTPATNTLTLNGGATAFTNNAANGAITVGSSGAPVVMAFAAAQATINNNSANDITFSNGITNAVGTIQAIAVSSGSIVFNGVISGSTGINVAGAGTGIVRLKGANTYSGGTALAASTATIDIASSTALGNTTGTFTITAGTITNSAGANITLNAKRVALNGSFTYNSPNALVFPPAAYTNTTGAKTITVSGVGGLTLTGDFNTNVATSITKAGTGPLTLGGASAFTGGVTLSAGTLNIANSSGVTGPVGSVAASVLTLLGGTIDAVGADRSLANAVTINGSFAFTGTNKLTLSGAISENGVSITANSETKPLVLSGNITGAASRLTIAGTTTSTGAGGVVLSGSNTALTGGVTINSGKLHINNANALGTVAGTFIINGGTLDNTSGGSITNAVANPITMGSFSWNGTAALNLGTGAVAMGAFARTITSAGNGILTIGGIINGSVAAASTALTIGGSGNVALGGANTYTGKTVISTGAAAILSSPTASFGGTPGLTANQLTISGILGASASASIPTNSGITIPAASTATFYATTGNTLTINSIIAGATGGVILNSNNLGTVVFAGANTFSGSITVAAGTLIASNASSLGFDSARSVTVQSGAALSLTVATVRSSFSTSIAGTGVNTNGAIIIANTGTNNLGVITLAAAASIRASSSGSLLGTKIDTAGNALTLQALSGVALTISAPITNDTGTGSVVAGGTADSVSQTGTVTLSSLTNGYSGDTTVSTGTMTVSGRLGSGSYAGNISIASGATFDYNSSSNQTLSGTISGAGALRRGLSGAGVLTITGTNTYTGTTTIFFSTISVPVLTASATSQPLGTNATLAFGSIGATGTLRYTGIGNTTNKVVNLAGTTTGGAIIANDGTGALVFTSNITGVSASGTRALTLSGSNADANDFQGIIANVGGGAGLTAFIKAGVGYWKLTGVNTFSGFVAVAGGQLDIPALTALGSGTKTISISSSTNRNGSMLLSGASVTYPSTLSWSLTSSGVDQTNSPLGAICAFGDSTIAGTVTLAGTSTVYANTGDLTFNGLVTGAATFGMRAASGRTITIAGGLGTATMTPYLVGPGTAVWNGVAANTVTTSPVINGGTLKMVMTASTGQFANTAVTFGSSPQQTAAVSSRYQYTGGTLEISNSDAAGAVDYTGLTSTSAINLVRGSGKLKLSRDSAQNFTVRLGSNIQPTSGYLTIEYGGSNPGVVGTSVSLIANSLGNGQVRTITYRPSYSALVPVWVDPTSHVFYPALYDGSQNLVAISQAGGTTLTLLTQSGSTYNFGFYNLTGDITAQVSARANSIRLDTGTTTPITLAAGAILQTQEIMDVGTGTARTILAGGAGSKLSRNVGGAVQFSVWTQNVTGTGATISADMDARFNSQLVKAGVGILTLSGKYENQSAMIIADGSVRIASTGTFVLPYAGMSFNNDYANAGGIEFNQSADPVVSHLNGGGANTTLTLNGGDLVLTNGAGTGTTGVFGGTVSLSASQKLKIRSVATNPEVSPQIFQGAFPFTAIEMSRGYISLDPQYGATVTGTPSVTATGGSRIDIQAANPLEADYTVNFGALTVTAGALQVRLANTTASTNPYAVRISAASFTLSGDSTAMLLNQPGNVQQTFAIGSISAGPMGNGVNVYNGTNIAYYRTVGQTFANGGTVPAGGSVDVPIYGTDTNFSVPKTTGVSFTSAGVNDNVSVLTTAITAQNTVTVKSLRSAVNITMAAGQRLTTDAIVPANTFILAGGEIATQMGSLYIYNLVTGVVFSSNIVDGASPTKLILFPFSTMTLSGTNSYSGGTLMQSGGNLVTLSGASPLGTGAIVGNGGAGFTIASGTFTFGATNTITLNDGGLRLDAQTGATYVLNGAISGTGDLFLTGAGTFTLGAVGTGTGALRMSSSSSTVTVNAAQAFTEYDFNNSSLTFRYGTGYMTDISALITKRPGNTYRIDTNGQSVTWASSVGNGSTYIKTGTGTHTLGAENFFAAATVSTGTVQAGNVAALGYGNVTLSAGTTLQTLTTGGQNGKLTITGTLTNSAGGTIRIGG